MSTKTCQWIRGCTDTVECLDHCGYHYRKLRKSGRLATILVDAGPTVDLVRQHLTTRGVRDLAKASGVSRTTLYRLRDAEAGERVYADVADKIRRTQPRPTDIGCVRRVQALRRLGYPLNHIAGEVGIGLWNLKKELHRRTFTDRIAAQIDSAYERLAGTAGPSPQLARRAQRQGFASPMAWDGINIDDPAAEPDPGEDTTRSLGDTVAEYRHLTRLGVTPEKAAAQLGMELASIERAIARLAGREPRAERRCSWCGEPFTTAREDQRYHTAACRRAAIKARNRTSPAAGTSPGRETTAA